MLAASVGMMLVLVKLNLGMPKKVQDDPSSLRVSVQCLCTSFLYGFNVQTRHCFICNSCSAQALILWIQCTISIIIKRLFINDQYVMKCGHVSPTGDTRFESIFVFL